MTLSPRLRMVAVCWIAVATVAYLLDLSHQLRVGLTNGAGRPFGDDFINFWSAPYLAWHGHAATIYTWNGFHAFETTLAGAGIDFYHYSYPPVTLILTAPLAWLPYIPALFVWLVLGWLCFYIALRAADPRRGTWLLALAAPAVFINAIGGQNGTWTAALLGGGLALLERRPLWAGVLFGLLIFKPQLGLLLPVALLAGREYRAFAAAAVTAVVLVAASVLLFGTALWSAYFAHATVLRHIILEDGTGVWHRMVSVFVFARRLGANVPVAYAAQAIVGVIAAAVVAAAWYSEAARPAKYALLVLGTCLATPYLQDYDLVVGVFVVVWLAALCPALLPEKPMMIGAGLILLLPFVAAPLARVAGLALGALLLLPVFVIAARAAFRAAQSDVAAAGTL